MVRSLLDVPFFEEDVEKLGLHFLDIYHKQYCGTTPHWEGSDKYEPRTPSAVELSEAGIQFKKSNTESIKDVDFENGVLTMPLLKFYDSTDMQLLNLMAFEWLHPDAKYDVSHYISIVDKITESERDVALLRSKGLFVNMIGSDKVVVEMFSTLTTCTKLVRTPPPRQQARPRAMEGERPLQEAPEQVAHHVHEQLPKQPLGVHLLRSRCHPAHRHHHADHLHRRAVLHKKGLAGSEFCGNTCGSSALHILSQYMGTTIIVFSPLLLCAMWLFYGSGICLSIYWLYVWTLIISLH